MWTHRWLRIEVIEGARNSACATASVALSAAPTFSLLGSKLQYFPSLSSYAVRGPIVSAMPKRVHARAKQVDIHAQSE